MPTPESLKEANRVMGICNACRYCEGFCAVFPAMERRRTFSNEDLIYLANLCHNCRGCYYACQYAPPHEFDLNCPKILQELRVETYQDFTWPNPLAALYKNNGMAVGVITAVMVAIVLIFTFLLQGPEVLFATHLGDGAFYEVIPYMLIVVPTSLIGLYVVVALLMGFVRFWHDTGGTLSEVANPKALIGATRDMLRLKYLDGGGHGCNYPDDQFSQVRKGLHHQVFYGFMLCLASTTVAAIYDHLFHWDAPYPYFSLPVILGTVGGIMLLIGTGGLFWYKLNSDPAPANTSFKSMDLAFSVMLFLTSLTGLLLLVLRETPAMGTLLAVHLGVVFGLFLTMPYGKFVHAVYRYAALVRNSIEELSQAHVGE